MIQKRGQEQQQEQSRMIMTVSTLFLALIVATNPTDAFQVSSAPVARVSPPKTRRYTSLPMSSDDNKEPDAVVKSVLSKQIAYDEKSGRFFESTIKEEDCAPEGEFCVLDKESGEMVRLTQEEKERIFMDALQVRCNMDVCYEMFILV